MPSTGQAGVALEVEDGALDVVVVDAALGAGVEAQQVELDLEGEHVVAAEGRLAQVEQAVAERVAGLHELAPRVGADDAVGQQAALLLKGEHGELRVRAEEAVDALAAQLEALPAQAGLDVEDFFAAVAAREVRTEWLLVEWPWAVGPWILYESDAGRRRTPGDHEDEHAHAHRDAVDDEEVEVVPLR